MGETGEALCAKLPLYKYQYKDLAEAAMKAIDQQKRKLQSAQKTTIRRYQQETEQLNTLQYSGGAPEEFAKLVENHKGSGAALQYQDEALKVLEKQLAKVKEGTLRFDQKAQNIVQASGTGNSDTLCCKQDVSDWVSDFFFNEPEPDVDVVSMFRASDRALMYNLDGSTECAAAKPPSSSSTGFGDREVAKVMELTRQEHDVCEIALRAAAGSVDRAVEACLKMPARPGASSSITEASMGDDRSVAATDGSVAASEPVLQSHSESGSRRSRRRR